MCVTSGGSDGARRAIDSRGGGAIVPIRKRFRRGKSFYENDTNERGSWLPRGFRSRENLVVVRNNKSLYTFLWYWYYTYCLNYKKIKETYQIYV